MDIIGLLLVWAIIEYNFEIFTDGAFTKWVNEFFGEETKPVPENDVEITFEITKEELAEITAGRKTEFLIDVPTAPGIDDKILLEVKTQPMAILITVTSVRATPEGLMVGFKYT